MEEVRREILGYKNRYEVTMSGKIISLSQNRPMARCRDDYGFHIVKLKNEHGETKNHNVYELWRRAFPEVEEKEFKGALKPKYGTNCKLLNNHGTHII